MIKSVGGSPLYFKRLQRRCKADVLTLYNAYKAYIAYRVKNRRFENGQKLRFSLLLLCFSRVFSFFNSAFELSLITCVLSVFTCVLSVFTCELSLFTCTLFLDLYLYCSLSVHFFGIALNKAGLLPAIQNTTGIVSKLRFAYLQTIFFIG